MPLATGTSNLFFNRDTKVFVSSSLGRSICIASNSGAVFTTSVPHGLSVGDRVTVANFGAGTAYVGLGNTPGDTVFYVTSTSLAASTFTLAETYALATQASPVVVTPTNTPTGSTARMNGVDGWVTPTAMAATANELTVTVANSFAIGDNVLISGVYDAAVPNAIQLNGVYKITSIVGTAPIGTGFKVLLNGTFPVLTVTAGTLTSVKITKINMWEIPVLSGYSMSQSTSTSEVTLNEMVASDGISRRARQMFNDALAPVEWSFDTYVRPFKSTSHYCVEEPLWAHLLGRAYSTVTGTGSAQTTVWAYPHLAGGATTAVVRGVPDDLRFNFGQSNVVTLGTLDLYFVLGANKVAGSRVYTAGANGADTAIYRVGDGVINEVSITFDIDGISTLSWSGMGSTITELGAFHGNDAGSFGISSNSNFIRNRLTALTASGTLPNTSAYTLTLTGGSITINNNISYLTPEVLGVVNKPIGHVTGTRTISGTFSCYMDEITGGSIDLFQDLAQESDSIITNSFSLDFYVGGGAADVPTAPGVQFSFPTAHLEIPTINFDDVISTEVTFHALPSTIGGTNEIDVIRYRGTNL
jgi:hypothetical protein